MRNSKFAWGLGVSAAAALVLTAGVGSCAGGAGSADVGAIARERGLSDADILAAVKTYQPTGKLDEYLMFGSGGHSGRRAFDAAPQGNCRVHARALAGLRLRR
jgi:nitrous oxide reductase